MNNANAACLLILTAALAGPVACSGGPGAPRDLASMAQAERPERNPSFASAPRPPGVPADLVAPVDPSNVEARATIEEIRAAFPAPEPRSRQRPEAPSDAVDFYVRGRAALADGRVQEAIALLERAVEVDPDAAAAWRDLGEARRQAGQRFAADAAHREALAVNPNERRSLLRLGLDAADTRDFERAARLLSRIDLQAHPGDPAERYLVWANLGRALIETGRLAAGVELMEKGLDLPERFTRPTIFMAELERLYRQRASSWREVGDAAARLDDPAAALAAYEQAAAYPSFDPVGLLARQLYALAALGRHATAAQTLLERIAGGDDGFTLEDRHIELIGYVAAASPRPERLGRAMESRLRELIAQLPAEEREARASRLALARAAALPDEEAMRVLRERIAEAPGDSGAISALLRRAASGEDAAPELARQVTALIAQSPLDERAYTGAAIRLADDAGSLLDAMPDSGAVPPAGPEDRARMLLRARLLTTLGRDEEAETILRALVRSDDAFAPAVSALAELLIDQRRLDEASIVIDQLDPAAGEPALLAKAGGLASVGREDEARELLEAAADRPDASAALVFRLGALLERSGDAEGAAERYAQAVDLNPRLEEAHAALIRLYNRTGPLADRERLFAAVRKLREQIPSARTLRWLRAQELASTGQYGAAERALRDLAEERDDPLVTRALVSVWLATGSADEAETYLRERLDRTPAESELIVQLARTLSAQSRHEEAADLLRQQLERRPGDAAVSLRLETILRDELDRPEEADELALRRLETGPITVGGALQQAAVMLRQERFSLAAQQLRRALQVARERGVPLDLAQIRGSLGVVQRVGAAAQQDGALRADAIELMETIASLDVQLPEQAHRLRTLLLIAADSQLDRVERAVTRAYEDVGSQADAVATAAAQALFPTDPLAALRLVETAARATSRPSTRIATLWLGLLAQIPDPGSAANLLELLVSTDLAAATARETLSNPENLAGATQGEAAATIAFALASAASGRDQQAESLDLYRLTLDYDPDHAMAGNNLGYQLLVDGDLDEAEPLIERAYANNNESPAIIDSLGWLRYKQGRFADELDPAGEVVSEGAVSILARAVEIALKQNDAGLFELHSHYGDALWRVGRTEEAIEQWRAARDAALALRRRLGDNAPSIVDESLDASQARLDAAAAGEAPPIAPTHAERTAPQDGDGVVPEPAGL